MPNGANLLNAIRNEIGGDYAERIPIATDTNIQEVGTQILAYESTQNDFLNCLVNKIAMTLVESRIANNPLKILKKGSMPLGMSIESIAVNPAKAESFNTKASDILRTVKPDVKTSYITMNRQDKYKVSINNDMLRTAFRSYGDLESLIAGIVNSLYSGNEFDEFLYAKGMFVNAFENGYITTKVVSTSSDLQASAKNIIRDIKTISGLMKFPSSNYNKYSTYASAEGLENTSPMVTWSDTDRQILIIRSDVLSLIDVDALAEMFNLSKAEFRISKVVEVDTFDADNKIMAILCDESYPQIWDNLSQMTTFYNGDTLTWNYTYHRWQAYGINPKANAVAFVTGEADEQTAPSSITASPTSMNLLVGEMQPIGVSYEPDNAIEGVTFTSSDTTVASVTKTGKVKAKSAGSATITIKSKADDTISTSVSVTVTE